MMDFDEFYRRLSEYIDARIEEEFQDVFDVFDDDLFGVGVEEMFDEMDEMIASDANCSCMYNTLMRTVELCSRMDEMEVPEETHRELFRLLDIEICED